MPLDVARLRKVHEDHETDEDDIDVPGDENVKHLDVINEVEGVPIIQQTTIDCWSILEEFVYQFNSNVCAHCGGASFFEAKLVIISDKFFVKQDKDNPIEDLEQKR